MLSFREHTLYGRDNEVFMITEAFCRVSGGDCESLFIGGFSGSGKSRLVNDLTERVDAVGGYVLIHKFDQIMSLHSRNIRNTQVIGTNQGRTACRK
jgi:predicted ATPase